MHLPASYAFRNLVRRPLRTVMTALGISAVVFSCVVMMAMSRGLSGRLLSTGEDRNVLAISRKGQNNMFSSIPDDEVVELYSLPNLEMLENGAPLVSPELMHMPLVKVVLPETFIRSPVSVRGITDVAFQVHTSVNILQGGREPRNSFEILAGVATASRLGVPPETLQPGRTIEFENRRWRIVGTFEAGGSLFESEFWALESDLRTVLRRQSHSFAVMRFQSPQAAREALEHFHSIDGGVRRFFKGWVETDYYFEFVGALAWVSYLSIIMVAAVAAAGVLIGVNTMYTSVVSRIREISVQRVLGFSRLDIAWSLTVEGLAIAVAGGAAGVVLGILLHGIPLNFSQGAFFLRVDVAVMLLGLALSTGIGVLGSVIPAMKALNMEVVDGLKKG